jgi:metallo-beta-lactamase family protein
MKLSFYGGAKSVTGANYLLDNGEVKILVDCGLFQGSNYAEVLNYEDFPYDASTINYVFITHSHTDHTGRLPKLYKEGFRGKIFTTKPAVDLMRETLMNNQGLIASEAFKDGHEPLFSVDDVKNTISLMKGFDYNVKIDLGAGIIAVLHDAGHILGSSIVELNWSDHSKNGQTSKIYFTGDLGNPPTPLLNSPFFPKDGDYVVIESAYGSRIHEDKTKRKDILEDVIEETVVKGGTVMIPSFAMERTQELLYEINQLLKNGRIPKIPIYLDSPLAIKLTEVFKKYKNQLNYKAISYFKKEGSLFKFPMLRQTMATEQSKAINNVVGPKVIIAGSGMSIGGRILHHEKKYLSDPNSAILFVGYQVKGSLGRKILSGATRVNIFGQSIPIRCKVKAIGGYSSHADQVLLLKWIKGIANGEKLKKVFVVQGEEESSQALADKVRDNFAIDAVVPNKGDQFDL